jgi:hypothetical protein
MNRARIAKGPAPDGSRGFAPRKPKTTWVAVFTDVKSWGQPATLIRAPTSFAEARTAALVALRAETGVELTAAENFAWRAENIRPADLDTAFPATERHVEEHFNVGAYKKGRLYRTFYLIPQNSYMWANVKRLWIPEPAEEHDPCGDHDRHYESDPEEEDYYERWERECSCDVSGPYFCSCRDRDDDY